MVRALIAEDEPLARRTLRELLVGVPWLEVIGEAEDGRAAVGMIDEFEPDLVFLDVQMPELSGLEVLERVRHDPYVVFTTAFDEYAVAAFELEAVDYLVKPFGRKRFSETIERVQRRLEEGSGGGDAERAREALGTGPVRRIFARRGNAIVPFAVDAIVRVEAGEHYVRVHTTGETFLLSLSLGELEQRLDPERFRRIHRSHIVNMDFITSIEPHDDRRLRVTLQGGSTVVASRAGSQDLRGLVS